MIIYTNKHGIPRSLANAIIGTPRDNTGDFSVTELIGPAKPLQLVKLHDVEVDVMDLIPAFMGTAVHAYIERFADPASIVETRMFMRRHDVLISGMPDEIEAGIMTLNDWKTDSVWKWIFKDFTAWERQGNLYHLLATENNHSVERLRFVGIIKDWSATQLKRQSGYPEHPVQIHDVPIWTHSEQLSYLDERLHVHAQELPDCSDEDRWAKADKYAIMKVGRKTAVKLHDTLESANEHLSNLDAKHSIETRKGDKVVRCGYCPARSVCEQYKALTVPADTPTEQPASVEVPF